MSTIINSNTRLIIQGITGQQGRQQASQLTEYGTNIVAGVVPGKGGESVSGIPVYNTVESAVIESNATASLILVPPRHGADAIREALDADLDVVVAVTEGIPINEMLKIVDDHGPDDPILIGPNSPGVISPSESSACIFPGHLFKDGSVGLVSTSGTLMLKLARNLSQRDIGQSTAIGIGGDPIVGTSMRTAVEWLDQDPDTEAILLSGEIGGRDEQKAAEYVARHATTPVVGYIVGTTAPERQQMGHAGAIISDDEETAEAKIEAFKQAGITVGSSPIDAVEKAVALLSS